MPHLRPTLLAIVALALTTSCASSAEPRCEALGAGPPLAFDPAALAPAHVGPLRLTFDNRIAFMKPPLRRELAAGDLALTVRADALANLTWQLDCLAQVGRCATPAYRALWTDELGGLDDDDEAALTTWRELSMRSHRRVARGADDAPTSTGLPVPTQPFSLEARRRIAGLTATDLDDLRAQLALTMPTPDVVEAMAVVERFWPRFEPWYQAQLPRLEVFADGLVETFAAHELGALLDDARRFYGSAVAADTPVTLHLIARPDHELGASHGEQLETHSVVEVVGEEAAAERVGVIVHELCHLLLETTPTEVRARTLERLLAPGDAHGVAAAHLLDEVLATAIGNGLVARRTLSPEAFQQLVDEPRRLYDDAWISATALALLPRIDTALTSDETLDSPALVADHLEAVGEVAAHHGSVLEPSLMTLVVVTDASTQALLGDVVRVLRVRAMSGHAPLDAPAALETVETYSHQSTLLLVHRNPSTDLAEQLDAWRDHLGVEAIDALTAADTPETFLYVVERAPGAWLLIAVAPDETGLRDVIAHIARLDTARAGLVTLPAN